MAGKYQAYTEHKNTNVQWLGLVPKHWKLKRVKETACLINGYPFDSKKFEPRKGVPLVRIRDINSTITEVGFIGEVPPESLINNDDILIGMDGDFNVALWNGGEAALNQRVACVRADTRDLHKFIFYLLPFNMKVVNDLTYFTTVKHLSSVDILKTSYCLPPGNELGRIVSFLDHETTKIDTLIEKQQQLIKLLKEKRQAVSSHAVTKGLNLNAPMRDSGVEWLGEVPEHWVKKIKLSNVAESNRGSFVNGPFGSDLLADELKDEGVPVVYIRDIKRTGYKRKSTVCVTPEKAEQLEVCKVLSGDVIISKVGDPPGDACIYPVGEPNAIITQDVIRIRVDRTVANPYYLVMLLNSDFGQMVMNGISVEGTRKRVSLGDFKATKIVLPPLNDQDDIVNYVNDQCVTMDILMDKSENVVGLIRERRTALISAAVTGKIDVRNWQAPEQGNKVDAA